MTLTESLGLTALRRACAQLARLVLEWLESPDERDIVTQIKETWL